MNDKYRKKLKEIKRYFKRDKMFLELYLLDYEGYNFYTKLV